MQSALYIMKVIRKIAYNKLTCLKKEKFMAKGKDSQKTVKKKSLKTLKEKRQEKKEKKANKR
jgi:hypothetical protein